MKEKAFFHNFKRAFNEANNIIFLEGESPTLMGKSYASVWPSSILILPRNQQKLEVTAKV